MKTKSMQKVVFIGGPLGGSESEWTQESFLELRLDGAEAGILYILKAVRSDGTLEYQYAARG